MQVAPSSLDFSFVEAMQGKDMITKAEGARVGKARGVIVDTSAMVIEAFTLISTAKGAAANTLMCIDRDDLEQIGDVVLITEEAAVFPTPRLRRNDAFLLDLPVKNTQGALRNTLQPAPAWTRAAVQFSHYTPAHLALHSSSLWIDHAGSAACVQAVKFEQLIPARYACDATVMC
jgi:sporulation protein YlmC with PRC-barrel domain